MIEQKGWQATVREELALFGHRNWIVVADSAYPAQSAQGIRTLLAPADHIEVVKQTIELIDRAPHVRPVVLLDDELDVVDEEDAPGIGAFRDQLKIVLKHRDVRHRLHDSIVRSLDAAGQSFRVIVIKTTMAMPYTSVFIPLECGYWTDDAETRLRARIDDL
jgi:hypothetical protein